MKKKLTFRVIFLVLPTFFLLQNANATLWGWLHGQAPASPEEPAPPVSPPPVEASCGMETGLTVDQRIAKCGGKTMTLKSTQQKFTVVAIDQNGRKFVKDDASGLIWAPPFPVTNWQAAINYCSNLHALGLKWTLPEKSDFISAGNTKNSVEQDPDNPALKEAMGLESGWLWSKSSAFDEGGGEYYSYYDGDAGELLDDAKGLPGEASCVSPTSTSPTT